MSQSKAAYSVPYTCPCGRAASVMHLAGRPTVAWRRCPMCGEFVRVYVGPYSDIAEVQRFAAPLGDDEQPEMV